MIVIGGGIAGLTAAYRLQQAGHNVRVLESAERVGGRMITLEWNGIRFDPGAEFITSGDQYLLEMVKVLGIEDKLVDFSEEQTGFDVSVMRDGEVHTVNFMSVMSYFGWKGVSLGARLSMAKLLPYMMRYGLADTAHPESAPGRDSLSMKEFFYRKISAEMFDYWAEPTFDVFCSYEGEDLSERMMLLLFGNYLGQKLYSFEAGIGLLPDTLASRLDVTLNAEATRIEMKEGGVKVHYRADGRTESLEADAAVIAVPGDQALDLFAEPRPAWQRFFPWVDYTDVGLTYFILESDDPFFDEGGIMFPRVEPWKLSALGWNRKPDGRIWVMADLKAYLYDPAISEDELRETITAEALRAVPRLKGLIKEQLPFKWARKVPKFPVGYLDALRTFKANPQEGPVYFCGDYLIGPSAGSALISGWQCADRILA